MAFFSNSQHPRSLAEVIYWDVGTGDEEALLIAFTYKKRGFAAAVACIPDKGLLCSRESFSGLIKTAIYRWKTELQFTVGRPNHDAL
ncbi:MAG: hypothetical protein GY832_24265 [Chloroflexi bacterium]|nr:hypothetical protein [Chloroflexota bacterium]